MLVLIKGAGDLASGVACTLHRAGIKIIMTDIAKPTVIRRKVAFAQAIYDGEAQVEGIIGVYAQNNLEAMIDVEQGKIPVIVDPNCEIIGEMQFDAVVDAILAKKNLGTKITDASIVIALGPGFSAGNDCHGIIETKRGHDLSRMILSGSAVPDTGVPGMVGGYAKERLIKAPADGVFVVTAKIGDLVKAGQSLGHIATPGGELVDVSGCIDGVLRGVLEDGLGVFTGMKIGDIDPRGCVDNCFSVSDKARAIGGGVLEAILHFASQNNPNLYNIKK